MGRNANRLFVEGSHPAIGLSVGADCSWKRAPLHMPE